MYCRSQMYLSKQMAQLRPELTMPMFSGKIQPWTITYLPIGKPISDSLITSSLFICSTEITHRFETARSEVRILLLQCLLPWLENMELIAANVTPATPLSYIMVWILLIIFVNNRVVGRRKETVNLAFDEINDFFFFLFIFAWIPELTCFPFSSSIIRTHVAKEKALAPPKPPKWFWTISSTSQQR